DAAPLPSELTAQNPSTENQNAPTHNPEPRSPPSRPQSLPHSSSSVDPRSNPLRSTAQSPGSAPQSDSDFRHPTTSVPPAPSAPPGTAGSPAPPSPPTHAPRRQPPDAPQSARLSSPAYKESEPPADCLRLPHPRSRRKSSSAPAQPPRVAAPPQSPAGTPLQPRCRTPPEPATACLSETA